MYGRGLGRTAGTGLICLMLALPADARISQVRPAGDGEPTPAACAAVGIDLNRDHQGREVARNTSRSALGALPPPPPPVAAAAPAADSGFRAESRIEYA